MERSWKLYQSHRMSLDVVSSRVDELTRAYGARVHGTAI